MTIYGKGYEGNARQGALVMSMPADKRDRLIKLQSTIFVLDSLLESYPDSEKNENYFIAIDRLQRIALTIDKHSDISNPAIDSNNEGADQEDTESDFNNYIKSRLDIFRSNSRDSVFESGLTIQDIPQKDIKKHTASVPFSLEVFTRILLLSKNVCSHEALSNELERLSISVNPKTLSTRIGDWARNMNYFMRLKGVRSAYMIVPSEIDGLKAAVPDISDDMWNTFKESVPESLLKRR
jgi:hypothetical protein